ncbi:hypothetical protein AYI69_g3056 [Smittium culicis]|uniref:Transmembrane protein n=1 Tax=Smittium culicis TaxID=133412 RepID=A0A1R1YL31_9FUNG|nr:hypothetical protein AYI69_g3056 [Smittium culicis]
MSSLLKTIRFCSELNGLKFSNIIIHQSRQNSITTNILKRQATISKTSTGRINLADIAWNYMVAEDSSNSEDESKAKDDQNNGELQLDSPLKRGLYASGIMIFGLGITSAILIYTTRLLTRASIVNSGAGIRLERLSLLRKKVVTTYPIHEMYSRNKLYTGKGVEGLEDGLNNQWVLTSYNGGLGFVFDRKGIFFNPEHLDVAFYRNRASS